MVHTDQDAAARAMCFLLGFAAARGLWMNRTKVAKLLYLADLRAVEHDGIAGSGVVWRWRPHGPFSNDLLVVENELVDQDVIDMDRTRNIFGKPEYHLTANPIDMNLLEQDDRFAEHLDAVLAEFGDLKATELAKLTYKTPPMIEAQANGEREALLDLDEDVRLPDTSAIIRDLQDNLRHLDQDQDDSDPEPQGCDESILEPLRTQRQRANRILLDS